MKSIRIGCGAGYSGDRVEPSLELVEKGAIKYLIYECLAERTIALAQQNKLNNKNLGYDPLLESRMKVILKKCIVKGIKIITNMGAANPEAGMQKIKEIAIEQNITNIKIAAVSGDDVLSFILDGDYKTLETKQAVNDFKDKILSANAYMGIDGIVAALKNNADVIITGRVADPSLFIAPLVYEFDWNCNDYNLLGKATSMGHLMECAGQVTGGYYYDKDIKEVPDLEKLGFPIAEIYENGDFFITKVSGSGGIVSTQTCKEQLLYEIHNPTEYLTPDVIADFSNVKFTAIGKDKIMVTGATGSKKPDSYKVSIGYLDSWVGEGQISYGGINAESRARKALSIVKGRFDLCGLNFIEEKYDLIGINSLHNNDAASQNYHPYEVRIRVICRTDNLKTAILVGNEVETLYTNGPYGGGGATKYVREVIAVLSTLIDAKLLSPSISYEVI